VSEAHASIPTSDAESFAILRALEFALEQGYARIQIRSSVNALRKRIRNEYRAERSVEDPLRARILELARRFAWVDFRLVARRKNQTARRLARDAWETLPCIVETATLQPGDPQELAEETDLGRGYEEDEPDSIPF
jgi:ribonuclease HI